MSRLIPDDAWAIMTIRGEARGESRLGKICVGEAIRTRMARRFFSDGTVAGTVLRAFQFSTWNTQDPNRLVIALSDLSDPVVLECQEAWLASAETTWTKGAMHYLNPRAVHQLPDWYDPKKITFREGAHEFLRL